MTARGITLRRTVAVAKAHTEKSTPCLRGQCGPYNLNLVLPPLPARGCVWVTPVPMSLVPLSTMRNVATRRLQIETGHRTIQVLNGNGERNLLTEVDG